MIQIKPIIPTNLTCANCYEGILVNNGYIWQGMHIFYDATCSICKEEILASIPVGQAVLKSYQIRKRDALILSGEGIVWLMNPAIKTAKSPLRERIKIDVEFRIRESKRVIILNTIDSCYGHSFLNFLNLQHIIKNKGDFAIVVIIQPFLKWLLPKEGVDEVWTVHVSFDQMRHYHEQLNEEINKNLQRFIEIHLSHAHLCPTQVDIQKFTKIPIFDFNNPPQKPRISFIWREDVNRFWLKSYWIYGGMRKLGIAKLLFPLHYLRVFFFLLLLRAAFKDEYFITLVGLGKTGWFPSFVDDQRVEKFNKETEVRTTKLYSESILSIGVHGSSMILPSAHAGMTISMMPLKRWGNFAEDLLFVEQDVRLASFQRRVIPMNTTILETIDICKNMLKGRDYFVKKFIYNSNEL
jgi:hypothetical protein